jgi:AP-3 complex subunit mu
MIDSIFILSGLGEVLIEKHYRHGTSRSSVADLFWERATLRRKKGGGDHSDDQGDEYFDENEDDIPPVVSLSNNHNSNESNKYAVHIRRGDLTLVAGLSRETPPMLVIEFLHRIADVLQEYLGPPDEVKIKDAFSTVYQILDEMMDGGLPLVTEPNALKGMIAPPTVVNKFRAVVMGGVAGSSINPVLPLGAVSTSPWRDKNLSYMQNEIFLDVEELLDCVLDSENEEPLSADVRGTIKVTTKLSGMPEVLLTFEDSSVLGDVSFHPCVRIDRWDRERVLSFLPPDGTFELMRYRTSPGVVTAKMVVDAVPFYCRPSVTLAVNNSTSISSSGNTSPPPIENHIPGRLEVLVGPRVSFRTPFSIPSTTSSSLSMITGSSSNSLLVEDVCVRIPLPSSAKFLNAKVGDGTKASFVDRTCVWQIGKLDTTKTALRLTGSFAVPLSSSSNNQTQIQSNLSTTTSLEFSLVARPVSGLKVANLEITNQSYKYFKGVKSVLKSGEYQIRS